jgi:tRNA modification GTPase
VTDTISLQHHPDTIVAISTPPGRGGIGIVRVSGPGAVVVAGKLIRLAGAVSEQVGALLGDKAFHARARFARVLDSSGIDALGIDVLGIDAPGETGTRAEAKAIDDALVTVFHGPHSYTGEDLVEIAAHGSPVVLETMVHGALAHGARPAQAGEFTQRAFLAGRLDLTQAEAVHDLIAAQTLDQARVAAQQMGGALSRRVAPAKESLLHLIALLEAGMDFASGELDDVDVVPPQQIQAEIAEARTPLQALAASFKHGQLLRNGAAIALVGRPNAGKSSLFNRLLERERAIVTAVPGTTRDTVEESVSLGGVPLRLVDTAGLRLSGEGGDDIDEAERLGIARSHEALADADLVLLIHDATLAFSPEEATLVQQLEGRISLIVQNKIDLLAQEQDGSFEICHPERSERPASVATRTYPALRTSAVTGAGLDNLRAAILNELRAEGGVAESGQLNTLRQHEAVSTTIAALDGAAAANAAGMPHEIVLLDLHSALRALDSLTGATTSDDILARIFSTFCIGK